MVLNFKWFKVEVIFTRAYYTPRQIRKQVQEVLWTSKSKLQAIKVHRQLTNFAPSLYESKQFVDSLPQPPKPEYTAD